MADSLTNVINPGGSVVAIPATQVQDAVNNQGYRIAQPGDVEQHFKQEKFGSLPQQALTAAEGIGEGIGGPIFTAAERASGLTTPENMLARRETNPVTHGAGQAAGLVGGSLLDFGESAALNAAGKGATELAGLSAPATALGRVGAASLRGATEMALLQAGDETSKMIMNDPNTSFQTALPNIGLAAAMGAGGGAALGAVKSLADVGVGNKLQKFIEDFRGRISEKLAAPESAEQVLQNGTAQRRATLDAWLNQTAAPQAELDSPGAMLPRKVSEKLNQEIPERLTPGQKAADYIIKKGMDKMSGDALGAGIGAAVGTPLGHAWLGALVGKQALGPLLNSVLPAIVKPILESPASGAALKSLAEYGSAIARGNRIMNIAAKNVFIPGGEVLSSNLIPTEKDRARLTNHIEQMEEDPEKYVQNADPFGQYLPDHAGAKGQVVGAAYDYLKSVKPVPKKTMLMDKERAPSPHQEAEYKKSLDLAEQPALIFSKIKNGTITSRDMQLIHTVYPAFYQSAVAKLHDELINHLSKENTLPYHTRVGLAKFFGEPLDSTMLPSSLASIQQSLAVAPQNPTMPPGAGAKAKAMEKQSNLLKTPQQASEERHTAQF